MSHVAHSSDALIARVRRIAGQVNSVEAAIIDRQACSTVLHRIAAVRGAINGLLDEVIADHLAEHVALPGLSDEDRRQGAEELLAVIRRYGK